MAIFASANPRTGLTGPEFVETTTEAIRASSQAARSAFDHLRRLSAHERALLLRAAAEALDEASDGLVRVADEETGLGTARLAGEVTRTTGQLRAFAEVLDEGSYVEAIIDHAKSDLQPPRADVRRMLIPLGPVAVFAASNFPFAFSVAGGDTASALAAGCSVLLKAHPSHPATSARTFQILDEAIRGAGAQPGTVALIQGASNSVGEALVLAPEIKAVGFTGSVRGGRALYDLAATRDEPIPVYAEMGSANPFFVTARALEERLGEVASGFAGSMTQGTGQFCTKPGLAFVPAGGRGDDFCSAAARAISETEGAVMLNQRMRDALAAQVQRTASLSGVQILAGGEPTPDRPGFCYPPTLMTCDVTTFRRTPELAHEHFGPVGLVVRYTSHGELVQLAHTIQGSLTATVHAGRDESEELAALVDALRERVGRLVWNGYPTGVAVTHAMHHGGPYPATSMPLFTSVGSTAIKRFLRPVAYQAWPGSLLPVELGDDNRLGILRLVDGEWVR